MEHELERLIKVSHYLGTKRQLRIYKKFLPIIREEMATRADLDNVRRAVEVLLYATPSGYEPYDPLRGEEEITEER